MAKVGTKRTELLAEIQKLTQEDQYKLLEELVLLLKNKSKEKHDIEELKGLGKDVWKSVNYLYLKEEACNTAGPDRRDNLIISVLHSIPRSGNGEAYSFTFASTHLI